MSSTYLLVALDKHIGDDSPQRCKSKWLRQEWTAAGRQEQCWIVERLDGGGFEWTIGRGRNRSVRILANNQLDALFFNVFVYFTSLYVWNSTVFIIRRSVWCIL